LKCISAEEERGSVDQISLVSFYTRSKVLLILALDRMHFLAVDRKFY
jgi:hypothetical protein